VITFFDAAEHFCSRLAESNLLEKPMEEHIRSILKSIGEDPDREGLRRTPKRVNEALKFLTRGYSMNLDQVINNAVFTEEYSEMIVQKNIDFYSLCEHHLLPFFGKAHVAYLPQHKIIGVSKLARVVDVFARRLQVQERLTNQIATTLMEKLNPLGVGVVIEAEHLCMRMRGVEKQNSLIITSTLLGAFRTRQETRNEFMNLIRPQG
jgi:GTP cyclohydrolase I